MNQRLHEPFRVRLEDAKELQVSPSRAELFQNGRSLGQVERLFLPAEGGFILFLENGATHAFSQPFPLDLPEIRAPIEKN